MVSSHLNPAAVATLAETGTTAVEPTPVRAEMPVPTVVPSLSDLIVSRARAKGLDGQLARDIAFCESSLRQFDQNGEPLRGLHNPGDIGLFQINEKYHGEQSRALGFDIHTTEGNLDYALWLIANEGTRHWKWSQPCWGK